MFPKGVEESKEVCGRGSGGRLGLDHLIGLCFSFVFRHLELFLILTEYFEY